MSGNIISPEDIDAILKAHDIVDTISKYVRLSKKGKNYSGLCPFHSEKTPSFSVNLERQTFKCFGCGVGGNAIQFIMRITGQDFVTVCREMADAGGLKLNITQPVDVDDPRLLRKKAGYEAYQLATELYHHILLHTEQARHAREYLESRGFHREAVEFFQIGYAPNLQGRGQDVLTKVLKNRQTDLLTLQEFVLFRFYEHENY
jgi:DNA primase